MRTQPSRKDESNFKQPIRGKSALQKIEKMLLAEERYLELCMFAIGCTSALRSHELVSLKVQTILDKKPGDPIRNGKAGHKRQGLLSLSPKAHKYLRLYFEAHPEVKEGEWLFPGRKDSHISTKFLSDHVKEWVEAVGLNPDDYACHSLRKSAGYHRRRQSVPESLLRKAFGHKDIKSLDAYLGIADDEVAEVMSEDYF
jgi:integrase